MSTQPEAGAEMHGYNAEGKHVETTYAKPAPATVGEWTPENVLSMLLGSQTNTPYSDVADTHNAAIAAERKIHKEYVALSEKAIQALQLGKTNLRRELAAEREQHQALRTVHEVFCVALRKAIGMESPCPISDILDTVIALAARRKESQQQLAVERGKHGEAWENGRTYQKQLDREQLDAEREKIQGLRTQLDMETDMRRELLVEGKQLRRQLDTAEKNLQGELANGTTLFRRAVIAENQLDAAVEALKQIKSISAGHICHIATALLAKIVEGKCTCDSHKSCQIHNPLTDNVSR